VRNSGKSLNLKQTLGVECQPSKNGDGGQRARRDSALCFSESHYSYAQDVRSCFDLGTKNNLSRNGPAARNRSMYEIASSTSISFSFVDYPRTGAGKNRHKGTSARSGSGEVWHNEGDSTVVPIALEGRVGSAALSRAVRQTRPG